MSKINILFLGGAKRVSLAERFIEAGDLLGYEVFVLGYELEAYVPLAAIGKIIIGKKWNDPELLSHLNSTIAEFQIDIILPFVDPATIILSKFKPENPRTFIPVSSAETCKIFFDKILANRWFIENTFPVPGFDEQFPLIAKPAKGSASQGLIFIESNSDFIDFQKKYDSSSYLIQKKIIGNEYTVDCYVGKDREIKSVIPRIRIETTGGEVSRSKTIFHSEIIRISNEILKKASFSGPITIQFLKDEKGIYLMEINPRFGGGVIASIEAGANIPLFVLKDFLNLDIEPIKDFIENRLMVRANREFFFDI
jgi:carbamoyl-phosphate synthase large subunit